MDMKEYIREFTVKDIVKVRNPKVVAIGGGTGLSVILRGLKKYTDHLSAIVTVADDGGGSGRLRGEMGTSAAASSPWPMTKTSCRNSLITAFPAAQWPVRALATSFWRR